MIECFGIGWECFARSILALLAGGLVSLLTYWLLESLFDHYTHNSHVIKDLQEKLEDKASKDDARFFRTEMRGLLYPIEARLLKLEEREPK